MSFKTRRHKIKKISFFPLLITKGRPTKYQVKGRYFVNIPYTPQRKEQDNYIYYQYNVSCFDRSDFRQLPPCKGNSNGAVCFHSLAAIEDRVKWQGKELSLTDSFNDAVKLLNFGGQLVKIEGQGSGEVWGVVR